MQRLEVSGAVRPIYESLGVKRLISVKNKRCFTWRCMHIYYNISLNSSYNEKYFRQFCRKKSKHILCSVCIYIFFFLKSRLLWDNVEKYYTAGQAIDVDIIRRMHFACWKSTLHTHPRYITMRFHGNNGNSNAPLCYVIRTLPVLLMLILALCAVIFEL